MIFSTKLANLSTRHRVWRERSVEHVFGCSNNTFSSYPQPDMDRGTRGPLVEFQDQFSLVRSLYIILLGTEVLPCLVNLAALTLFEGYIPCPHR